MFFFLRQLRRTFPGWERSAQIGFALAVMLLAACLVIIIAAPQEQRPTFLIAFGALILVAQVIFLWANRGMVTPLTQAQRSYMRGDFDAVVGTLGPLHAAGKADVRMMTLLGNTYRQLGRLDESAAVLSEAVDKLPNHHYPLYGFGRTLIVQGHYAQGTTYIERAVEVGAPPVVHFDLAEAYGLMGRWQDALRTLEAAPPSEPPHVMMAAYWRYSHGHGAKPSTSMIAAGLPYWQAQAKRFAATDYGEYLASVVTHLTTLMNGDSEHGSES